MADINYTRDYLNSLNILDLRLIAQSYGNNIPRTKLDLIEFIINWEEIQIPSSNMSINNKNSIGNALFQARPLPDRWAVSKYVGEIYNDNFAKLIRNYYLYRDRDLEGTFLLSFTIMEEKDQIAILEELGLSNFKGAYEDLFSLLNILPGLNWNSDKAREITSYSMGEILSLTDLSYFNAVLAYATGYCLNYNPNYASVEKYRKNYDLLNRKSPKYIAMAYLSSHMLPDINENLYKSRVLDHIYDTLVRSDLSQITPMLDIADNYNTAKAVNMLQMRPPSHISNPEYFLNSVLEYRDVGVDFISVSEYSEIPSRQYVLENLIRYSDRMLLEIAEVTVKYDYRFNLEDEVRNLLQTYSWSLDRTKYCKTGKKYNAPILSYGTALNYYCYDYKEISKLWSSEEVIKNKGFLRPDYVEGEPHQLLTSLDLLELKNLLDIYPQKNRFADIRRSIGLHDSMPIRERGKQRKLRMLVICFDDGSDRSRLNPTVFKALKNRFNVNFDGMEIDYIGSDIMYIGDKYYIIANDSFPDNHSLQKLSEIIYQYDFIVYESCPLGDNKIPLHKLLNNLTLNILNNKLKDSGYLLLTNDKAKNINAISTVFHEKERISKLTGQISRNPSERQMVVFDKMKGEASGPILPAPSIIQPTVVPSMSTPQSRQWYNIPLDIRNYAYVSWATNSGLIGANWSILSPESLVNSMKGRNFSAYPQISLAISKFNALDDAEKKRVQEEWFDNWSQIVPPELEGLVSGSGPSQPSPLIPPQTTSVPPSVVLPGPFIQPSIVPPPIIQPPMISPAQPFSFPAPTSVSVPVPVSFRPAIPSGPLDPTEEYLGPNWKSRWEVKQNPGGGDCLYCVISQALASTGEHYEVAHLRDILAESVTLESMDKWRDEYINDQVAHVTLELWEEQAGLTYNQKKIQVSETLSSQKYTVDEIKNWIKTHRYGTMDDLKILSEVFNFIPILIPIVYGPDKEYVTAICGGVDDPERVANSDLYEKNIILVRWDVLGSHYDLIAQKGTNKMVFKSLELPEALLVQFTVSCGSVAKQRRELEEILEGNVKGEGSSDANGEEAEMIRQVEEFERDQRNQKVAMAAEMGIPLEEFEKMMI